MIAVPHPIIQDVQLAQRLRRHMAALVEVVCGRMVVDELLLEGGATAEAVLGRLGWQAFWVAGECGPGVVHLNVAGREDLLVTVKPGSYPWPAETWSRRREGTSYAT